MMQFFCLNLVDFSGKTTTILVNFYPIQTKEMKKAYVAISLLSVIVLA